MTIVESHPESVGQAGNSRDDLEAAYLRALMRRDARVYAERTTALSHIKSKTPVAKWNYLPVPKELGTDRWPDRPCESIFEEPWSIGRL